MGSRCVCKSVWDACKEGRCPGLVALVLTWISPVESGREPGLFGSSLQYGRLPACCSRPCELGESLCLPAGELPVGSAL